MRASPRNGVALILVLWIAAILTLLLYAFLAEMQVEHALAAGFADEKKAEQLAWSAVDAGCARLLQEPLPFHALWQPWSHDEARFREVALGEGAYTLLHPTYAEDGRRLWGAEDEASRLNLNTASREALLRLPRMTEEVADSVLDWRDEDGEAAGQGAEDGYYLSLDPPYRCKNQPFETVEELLLVRGMTPEILYGEDANLNGRLDPNEDDGDDRYPRDNRDGRLDPGLWSLVTVWSVSLNRTADGEPRVNVNTAPPSDLVAAGLSGGEVQGILVQRDRLPYPSPMHLLGSPLLGMPPALSRERFAELADRLTTAGGDIVPGLVNVNTAPRPVLLALPGMTEALAAAILARRAVADADLGSMAWLLEVADPAELQPFAHLITCRADQFRFHAVGRIGTPARDVGREGPPGRARPFRRLLAIHDFSSGRPRLVYWKDLSRLGLPYDPEETE